MAEPKPAPSVAELKKLEAQLLAGRESAKAALLTEVNAKLAELKEIGFDYQLVEAGNGKTDSGRKCSLCNQAGHSARTCPTAGAKK